MQVSLTERFTSKVVESTTKFYDGTACQEFQSSIDRGGYGRVSIDGKMKKAHRISYELFVGPIPKGLVIDHLCQNRCCINPAHLEPVTQAINIARIYNRQDY